MLKYWPRIRTLPLSCYSTCLVHCSFQHHNVTWLGNHLYGHVESLFGIIVPRQSCCFAWPWPCTCVGIWSTRTPKKADDMPWRIHECMVYLPTFTIKSNYSCRITYHSHGSVIIILLQLLNSAPLELCRATFFSLGHENPFMIRDVVWALFTSVSYYFVFHMTLLMS